MDCHPRGIVVAEMVAQEVVNTMHDEKFMVLPHPRSPGHPASSAAFPPAAVVFTVTVCSAQNRYR